MYVCVRESLRVELLICKKRSAEPQSLDGSYF